MGIFGASRPTFDIPSDISQMASAAPKKDKFFNKSFFGNALGNVGDLLLQDAGFASQFAPQQMEQRRLSLMEQQRQQDMQDWQAKQDYERANPKPAAPNDTERDYEFYKGLFGEERAKQMIQRPQAVRTVDPVTGEERTYFVTPDQINSFGGGSPARPVGKLTPYTGGGTGNGSGNFR